MSSNISFSTHRKAVGALFFMHGICFSSWASQIPVIQQQLGLSEVELGFFLFAIPVGRFVTMPASGWLVSTFGSKKLAVISILLCTCVLLGVGIVRHKIGLWPLLFFFGVSYNMVVISLNMQGVVVEKMYQRSIMASFHGLWSLAGFAGALLATLVIANSISTIQHFVLIGLLVSANVLYCAKYLPEEEKMPPEKRRFFMLPKGHLLFLGFIAFCCLICEGTMYDWSGIYFGQVVVANRELAGLGYSGFMCAMAAGRFISDWYVTRFGLRHTLQISGILIFIGLITAVFLPYMLTALLGFVLVGFGVSSIIPMVYAAAGKSDHVPAPTAIVMVSTVGFTGFIIGPPLIGMVAGASSLKVSFGIVALMGLAITFLASKLVNRYK